MNPKKKRSRAPKSPTIDEWEARVLAALETIATCLASQVALSSEAAEQVQERFEALAKIEAEGLERQKSAVAREQAMLSIQRDTLDLVKRQSAPPREFPEKRE